MEVTLNVAKQEGFEGSDEKLGIDVDMKWRVAGSEWQGFEKTTDVERKQSENPDTKVDRLVVDDPLTPAGQQLGAILVVKQFPLDGGASARDMFRSGMMIGDCVKVLSKTHKVCGFGNRNSVMEVENLRTGDRQTIPWEAVFPVGPRELCYCPYQECKCLYVNYKMSKAFEAYGGEEEYY